MNEIISLKMVSFGEESMVRQRVRLTGSVLQTGSLFGACTGQRYASGDGSVVVEVTVVDHVISNVKMIKSDSIFNNCYVYLESVPNKMSVRFMDGSQVNCPNFAVDTEEGADADITVFPLVSNENSTEDPRTTRRIVMMFDDVCCEINRSPDTIETTLAKIYNFRSAMKAAEMYSNFNPGDIEVCVQSHPKIMNPRKLYRIDSDDRGWREIDTFDLKYCQTVKVFLRGDSDAQGILVEFSDNGRILDFCEALDLPNRYRYKRRSQKESMFIMCAENEFQYKRIGDVVVRDGFPKVSCQTMVMYIALGKNATMDVSSVLQGKASDTTKGIHIPSDLSQQPSYYTVILPFRTIRDD